MISSWADDSRSVLQEFPGRTSTSRGRGSTSETEEDGGRRGRREEKGGEGRGRGRERRGRQGATLPAPSAPFLTLPFHLSPTRHNAARRQPSSADRAVNLSVGLPLKTAFCHGCCMATKMGRKTYKTCEATRFKNIKQRRTSQR